MLGAGVSMSASQRVSRFRLNGWQRIGIVLSVVWILVGALWGWMFATADYRSCVVMASSVETLDFCNRYHRWVFDTAWVYSLLVALVPIPIAWLLVYGVSYLVRWIKSGFKQE
jgi:hypothetical protein